MTCCKYCYTKKNILSSSCKNCSKIYSFCLYCYINFNTELTIIHNKDKFNNKDNINSFCNHCFVFKNIQDKK